MSVTFVPVIASYTLDVIVMVLSLTACLGVSYRSPPCSVGWCTVSKNFPISSSAFDCSVTVVVGVFVVNFGVSKFPKRPGSDGSGFTGFFEKY
ncbi:MAG: hypothetical protein EZS28_053017 [Streblomastix strix]|uniref:Uncharacterized protein n=1 Tax=Streblomastix strix TaxID=222440 RepID=A0A5J4RMV3_9EUKA|nr:MAG: hypothetical protein EZS28_053017 [Streblomastix strix]